MSEICLNCPINDNDTHSVVLNEAAAHMANIIDPSDVLEMSELDVVLLSRKENSLEASLEKHGFSQHKISQARKCAEHILWNTCEFRSHDY